MKTILLGMNNPQSDSPGHALFPHPPGCAGYRLWAMLSAVSQGTITRSDFLDGFERINLLDSRVWDVKEARKRAPDVLEVIEGRRVVVLGRTAWKTLLWPQRHRFARHLMNHRILDWKELYFAGHWTNLVIVPHPSGRCREYNSATMQGVVGDLLLQEYRRASTEVRVGSS